MSVSEFSEAFFKVMDKASCHGVPNDWFYPEQAQWEGDKQLINRAREICMKCPIYKQCYDHSIRHEEFGLWAGMSPRQRRSIRVAENIPFLSFTLAADTWRLNWQQSLKRNRQVPQK